MQNRFWITETLNTIKFWFLFACIIPITPGGKLHV